MFLVFFLQFSAAGQKNAVHTPKKQLLKANSDTAKINALINHAWNIRESDLDTFLLLNQQALILSEKINYELGKAISMNRIGVYYQMKNEHSKSMSYYERSLDIFSAMEATSPRNTFLKQKKIGVIGNLGNAYMFLNKFNGGREFYEEALKKAAEIKDNKLIKDYSDRLKDLEERKNRFKIIDSLYSVLKHQTTDTARINTLNDIAWTYQEFSLDSVSAISQRALKLSQCIGYDFGIADAFNALAIFEKKNGNRDKAIDFCQKSEEKYKIVLRAIPGPQTLKARRYISGIMKLLGDIYFENNLLSEAFSSYKTALQYGKDANDLEKIHHSLFQLSTIAIQQVDYASVLEYSLEGYEISKQIGNVGYQIDHLINLGIIYDNQNKLDKAYYYYNKALILCDTITDKRRLAVIMNNLGYVGMKKKDYDNSLFYLKKGLRLSEEMNDIRVQAFNTHDIGNVYELLGDHQLAILYYDRAIQLFKEVNHVFGLAMAAGSLGKFYFKINKIAEAEKALKYSLVLADSIGSLEHLYEAHKTLSELYEKVGNTKLSLLHFKTYSAIKDSVEKEERQQKQTRLELQVEYNKKEAEIKAEQAIKDSQTLAELSRQKLLRNAFIIGLLLLFIFFGVVIRQNRKIAKAKKKAEESERFKQQFLANMSHEIRTPMNAVMGMTNLLIDKKHLPEQMKYLSGIRKSSDTLLHIINDILDLSKIEAGKMDLEQIDFSIHDVSQQVLDTLQHKAEEKGLQLVSTIRNIPKVVVGDPVRLNQVLMNLMGNAIKFTEKGSVELRITSVDGKTKFEVIDTGIGIPKDKLNTVFENFSQANSSDTRKYGGTGLGLSISKQLVELHGGNISIESELGKGSCFSFEVTYLIGSEEKYFEQLRAGDIDGSVLNGLRILLADDNEYNRTVANDTLTSKASVTITEAHNGKEALELLQNKDFDIILMDVQMPMMDGYEATRQIRKLSSEKNKTPIIALTASVIRSDLDKCKEAGMNDYVPKPFKTSELISAIAKATGRKVSASHTKTQNIEHRIKNEEVDSVTDLTYLTNFCEGDKVRMKKYINIFLTSVPSFTDTINEALAKDDLIEIANQVHGYKTKLVMMGMNDTKDISVKIERQCREGATKEEAKEKIMTLLAHIKQATDELAKVV